MTRAVSPSCGSARRTPCMAIAPTVENAACSGATPRGTAAHRLTGTQLYSACRANSLPAAATSWPTLNSSAPGPDLDDDAAQRVAERGVGVELVHHLLVGGHRALLRDRVQHLAHLVGPGPRLADHGQAGLGDLHHLGAGGDEREQRLDQDAARAARRDRHVEDGELPGLVVLRDLLHGVLAGHAATPRTARCGTTAPATAAAISAWTLSSRPARSSAIRRFSAAGGGSSRTPASSPSTSTSSMTSRRSLRTQARSGAPKEALGR